MSRQPAKQTPKAPSVRAEDSSEKAAAALSSEPARYGWICFVIGLFLAISLLKFGNPPIMEKWVQSPANLLEFVLGNPWPLAWGYTGAALVVVAGLLQARWSRSAPTWIALLPAVWLLWQCFASVYSLDAALTRITLVHLCLVTAFFYVGLLFLGRVENAGRFWGTLFLGYLFVQLSALQQHFGGLEETRHYFQTYIYPTLTEYPMEYIRKINSNRVFGTLFYPNALAAALILLFPPLTVVLYRGTGRGRFTAAARGFLIGLWTLLTAMCMVWSGSKAGWLVMLVTMLVAFLNWPSIARKWRLLVACCVLAAGLGGFFFTYSSFFRKGAPSVGARFDYWRAAVQNVNQRPIYGSGPGTFAIPYKQLKAPEAEMSRLVHNDYLEQASDSGVPGFIAYLAFVAGALYVGYKRSTLQSGVGGLGVDESTLLPFAVWLGLAGWFIHSFVDFNLYIPALAWIAFTLMGWLIGRNSCQRTIQAA